MNRTSQITGAACPLLALLILVRCGSTRPTAAGPVAPAPDGGSEAVADSGEASPPETPAEVRAPVLPPYDALLQPWHEWDPSWPERAEVVVVGKYKQGDYPCIFFPDRSSVMPLRRTIVIEQVLLGTVRRGDFDFSGGVEPAEGFPLEYHDGRRYLAFLAPEEGSAALLQDPDARFNVETDLEPRELVAIIDLDQSEEEAREQHETVARWRELEAFTFTPEGWRAMRESPTADLRQAEAFFHVLLRSVVKDGDRREVLRGALGPPDDERIEDDGVVEIYQLHLAARRTPSEGMVTARLEITYAADGARLKYGERYEIYENGRFRDLTYEELHARHLTTRSSDWRRTFPW
ncbi:MAG: hypothetical protein HY905_18915 [Deltaproteobacteria bacterium]|nr:hypothetical protein [Deltaproteobacteria bacterium]